MYLGGVLYGAQPEDPTLPRDRWHASWEDRFFDPTADGALGVLFVPLKMHSSDSRNNLTGPRREWVVQAARTLSRHFDLVGSGSSQPCHGGAAELPETHAWPDVDHAMAAQPDSFSSDASWLTCCETAQFPSAEKSAGGSGGRGGRRSGTTAETRLSDGSRRSGSRGSACSMLVDSEMADAVWAARRRLDTLLQDTGVQHDFRATAQPQMLQQQQQRQPVYQHKQQTSLVATPDEQYRVGSASPQRIRSPRRSREMAVATARVSRNLRGAFDLAEIRESRQIRREARGGGGAVVVGGGGSAWGAAGAALGGAFSAAGLAGGGTFGVARDVCRSDRSASSRFSMDGNTGGGACSIAQPGPQPCTLAAAAARQQGAVPEAALRALASSIAWQLAVLHREPAAHCNVCADTIELQSARDWASAR